MLSVVIVCSTIVVVKLSLLGMSLEISILLTVLEKKNEDTISTVINTKVEIKKLIILFLFFLKLTKIRLKVIIVKTGKQIIMVISGKGEVGGKIKIVSRKKIPRKTIKIIEIGLLRVTDLKFLLEFIGCERLPLICVNCGLR